jgi:WhiB family transcriptional regulator, redox-sensing transcriptional regulator
VTAMTGWRDFAACRDLEPDLFFPPGTTGPAADQVAEAKQVCASCPVRQACLDWALRNREGHGVWGGMDEDERRAAAAPAAPRVPVLCLSGRHLKNGPGRCPGCAGEYQRKREKDRDRDYAAVYARRVARAREEVAA